mgnify:CR=1 FL=1
MPAQRTIRGGMAVAAGAMLALSLSSATLAQDEAPAPSEAPAQDGASAADALAADASAAAEMTLGPWHMASFDDAPAGHFIRGVASSELGTIALGNREFGAKARPIVWTSEDGVEFERATFAKDARKGVLSAAAANEDGWVAVGGTSPVRALAWYSPDGRHWKAAKVASAKGHHFADVAATPIGFIAVGCQTEFHCNVGKAWVSQDGRSWKVLSKLPIQLPSSIDTVGDRIVVAGFSDGWETNRSSAVSATSKNGRKWKLNELAGPHGSGFNGLSVRDGGAFASGYLLGDRAADDSAILASSPNGRDWTPIEPAEFHGWSGIDVSTSEDLVLMVGTGNFDDVIAPVTYSTADLESWTPGTFTEGLRAEVYHVFDSTFTHDGDRALMVGAIDYGPAIWTAEVAPVGSPQAEPAPVTPIGPVTPERFAAAVMPAGSDGASVHDVISGGPGYIAVGGGAPEGADPAAFAWTSGDGVTWTAGTVAADATFGVMEAVAALPEGGFVAVGSDPTQALGRIWRSDDGSAWERVDDAVFAASVVTDVVSTPDGVTVVGCEAFPDCRRGLSWSSPDGRTWALDAAREMLPLAVGTTGSVLTAGGSDGALGKPGGQAVIASSGGAGWNVSGALGEADSRIVDVAGRPDGIVAAGWQQITGKRPESALFVSTDAETGEPVTHKRLRDVTAVAVGVHHAGALLVGTKAGAPIGFWTRDLQDLDTIRFPRETQLDGLQLDGGGIVADGSMAFALGAEAGQPAIWYSPIE